MNKSVSEIELLLSPVTHFKNDQSTLDTIPERKINLRVQFVTRGHGWHLTIPVFILLEKKGKGTLIKCLTSINKPLILSLIFGLIFSLPVLPLGKWLAYGFFAFVLFSIALTVIMTRTIQTTKKCLRELKIVS